MAKQYRDYGAIGSNPLPLVEVQKVHHGQVYRLTHDGEGNTLPFVDRAYISFTYGGRKIEDFNLIATTVNDRIERESSPGHEDHTTNYQVLNGQFYWGSRYTAREMNLTLATDGMTQRELDDFKYWFSAGVIRQLIMSQHPNRGIMARVSAAPVVSIVPFTRRQLVNINDEQQYITIAEYKGTIQLNFVMDDPFWYSINSVLNNIIYNSNGVGTLVPNWTNMAGETINQLDIDAYKIIYEDNIPFVNTIDNSILFGNNIVINTDQKKFHKWTLTEQESNWIDDEKNTQIHGTPLANNQSDTYSSLAGAIAGPILIKNWNENQSVNENLINTLKLKYYLDNIGQAKYDTQNHSFGSFAYFPIKQGSTIKYKINDANFSEVSWLNIYNLNKQFEGRLGIKHSDKLIQGTNLEKINNIYIECQQKQNYYLITFIKKCFIRYYLQFQNYESQAKLLSILENVMELNLNSFQDIEASTILKKDNPVYLFYSGTAPCLPEISFEIPLSFDESGYINTFNNQYISSDQNYNVLQITSEYTHAMKITTPSIFTSYNKVINYLLSTDKILNKDISTVIKIFRNDINHAGVRNWIIGCINIYKNTKDKSFEYYGSSQKFNFVDEDMRNTLLGYMPYFFKTADEVDLSGLAEPTDIDLSGLSIEQQPKNYGVSLDQMETAKPKFQISSSTARKFQWQYSTDEISWNNIIDSDNSDFSGGNTSTLEIKKLENEYFDYYFRCGVQNSVATIFSNNVCIYRKTDITIEEVKEDNNILQLENNKYLITKREGKPLNISVKVNNITATNWYYSVDGVSWDNLTSDTAIFGENKVTVTNKQLKIKAIKEISLNGQVYKNFQIKAQFSNEYVSTPTVMAPIVVTGLYGQYAARDYSKTIKVFAYNDTIELTRKAKNIYSAQWTYLSPNNASWKNINTCALFGNNGNYYYELSPANSSSIDEQDKQGQMTTFTLQIKIKSTAPIGTNFQVFNGYKFKIQLKSYAGKLYTWANTTEIIYDTGIPYFIKPETVDFTIQQGQSIELSCSDSGNITDWKWGQIIGQTCSELTGEGTENSTYTFEGVSLGSFFIVPGGKNSSLSQTWYNSNMGDSAWCFSITVVDRLEVTLVSDGNPKKICYKSNSQSQDSITITWNVDHIGAYSYKIKDKNEENPLQTGNTQNDTITYIYKPINEKKIVQIYCEVFVNNVSSTSESQTILNGIFTDTDIPLDEQNRKVKIGTTRANYTFLSNDTCDEFTFAFDFNMPMTLNDYLFEIPLTGQINYYKNSDYSIQASGLFTNTLNSDTKFPFSLSVIKIQYYNQQYEIIETQNLQIANSTIKFKPENVNDIQSMKFTLCLTPQYNTIYMQTNNGWWPNNTVFKIKAKYTSESYPSNSLLNLLAINNNQSIQLTDYEYKKVSNPFFLFNNATGQFLCKISYNKILYPTVLLQDITNIREIVRLSTIIRDAPIISIEPVGDMILFNNFILQQHNCLDPQTNQIFKWDQTHKNTCHKLTYDGIIPLENFKINYKNLYL